MTDCASKLYDIFDKLKGEIPFQPKIAIVLGSGLGGFADKIEFFKAISYKDIPDMPSSTVEGHVGRFVFGHIEGTPVVAMQGRIHHYEGYSTQECVLPIRLMGLMGAEYLIVTNAAGGITYPNIGDLMLITDHICLAQNPLIGKNVDKLGVRFPDMTEPYSPKLREFALDIAKNQNIDLKQGVYIQFTGPSFETKAEVRMAQIMGADAVGMSTAIEVIAANHMGMKVMGISCITNPACGMSDSCLSHVDVQVAADKAGEKLENLIFGVIARIGKEL